VRRLGIVMASNVGFISENAVSDNSFGAGNRTEAARPSTYR
jgi:hypothetical protein